jgi:hypothetical protein
MDIRKKAVGETGTLHLRDADDMLMYEQKKITVDGEEREVDDLDKPVTVVLYGPGSKAYGKANTTKNNKWIERLKRKGKNSEQTPEEKIAEDAEFLAACTVSMNGIDYDGLQGPALFKAVYSDPTIGFIASQVTAHLGDWANFSKGSAKS